MPKRSTTGGTVRGPSPAPRPGARPEDPTDDILAAVLIRMWALASGRTLRSDVPPDQLSREELIAFWADDMTPHSGRHARPDTASGERATAKPGYQARRAPQQRRSKRRKPQATGSSGARKVPADPAACPRHPTRKCLM